MEPDQTQERSDLDIHFLSLRLLNSRLQNQTTFVVIGAFRVNISVDFGFEFMSCMYAFFI